MSVIAKFYIFQKLVFGTFYSSTFFALTACQIHTKHIFVCDRQSKLSLIFNICIYYFIVSGGYFCVSFGVQIPKYSNFRLETLHIKPFANENVVVSNLSTASIKILRRDSLF